MKNTKIGEKLQTKAENAKDKALVDAIMSRKINGLTKCEIKANLHDAANLVLEDKQTKHT